MCFVIFLSAPISLNNLLNTGRQEQVMNYGTSFFFFFFPVSWGLVRMSPLRTSATVWTILQTPDDSSSSSSSSRKRRRRRRRRRRWWWWLTEETKYSKKTCLSDILSKTILTWSDAGSNPAAAVRSQRLTAWAMARSNYLCPLTRKSFPSTPYS
jgi:hypothetical protein